jgi:hypothetical protein
MKKQVLFLAMAGLALSGCSLFDHTPTQSAPTGYAMGDVLFWDIKADEKVAFSGHYDIFKAGTSEKLATTTKKFYDFDGSLSEDTEVSIQAVSDDEKSLKSSSRSAAISVYRSSGFLASEKVEYDLSKDSNILVASTTRYVKLSETLPSGATEIPQVKAAIVISSRNTPLVIEANSINLLGVSGNDESDGGAILIKDVDTSKFTANNVVTFISNGTNVIQGPATSKTPAGKAENSDAVGDTGYPGGSAIKASGLVLKGSGSLSLLGGKGGKGGKGAGSSQYTAVNYAKAGGDGGVGGHGINASNIALAMGEATTLTLRGGAGGDGGQKGDNLSMFTGAFAMSGLKDGNPGASGDPYVGTLSKVSGILAN